MFNALARAALLFALVATASLANVTAQMQIISLTVTPSGLVVTGTTIDLDSCWNGFSSSQLSNAFFTGNASIQFSTGGTWTGLPTVFSGVLGNNCYRSTYVVTQSWVGYTIGLRAIYQPTGRTSNVVGLAVTASSQTLFVIQVTVIDQNGNDYNGVRVELWQGATLIDSGITNEGTWSTMPVPGGGRTYGVTAYNGRSYSQSVRLTSSNVAVTFQLSKESPSPMLVLYSVTITPTTVFVGKDFSASFRIDNVGTIPALASSLALNLSYPFAVIGSGTTLYLGTLGTNQTASVNATIAVDILGSPGTYSIPYALTYSDSSNYTYDDVGNFGISVRGTPMIAIQSISLNPANLYPETSGFLTISLVNTGTDRAINVRVNVFNGNDIVTSTISYVGEISPHDTTTISFGVQVQDSASLGLRSLTISIVYSDAYGQNYTTSQVYNTYIYPPQSFIPTYYVIAIIVAVLGIVLAYIAFRRLGYRPW